MNTATLNALAEPNRLRIVELLRSGPNTVGVIAEKLFIRQPQVSKHLKVLHQAGIVAMKPFAQQRVYQLQIQPFEELNAWAASFQRMWDARLDNLDAYLSDLQGGGEVT